MLKTARGAGLAAILSLAGMSPGFTQNIAASDLSAIETACLGTTATQETCVTAIQALVAGLQAQGLEQAQIDAALGRAATVLAEAALLPGSNTVLISTALALVATQVTDPGQAMAIAQIAATVAANAEIPVAALAPAAPPAPILASPN